MVTLFLSVFLLTTTITSGFLFGLSHFNSTVNDLTQVIKPTNPPISPSEKLSVNMSSPPDDSQQYSTTESAILDFSTDNILSKPSLLTPTKKITTNTPILKSKTLTQTSKPSASPIPPTSKPVITNTPSPFPTIDKVKLTANGLNSEKLFNMVNDYRSENGKPPFTKDETTCSIADIRATQVYSEIYGENVMHSGLKAMQLPYWITENIINHSTEEQAFNWWKNDTIHRNQMLGDFKYSCTSCSGFSCSQIFTSYIPK